MTIVFLDTETTSLRPDRRAWDIALIVREPGTADVEHQWFVFAPDLDLGNADLTALKIGRFYDRHPQGIRFAKRYDLPPCEYDVLRQVEELTRGAHLVGAVPNFDAEVLAARMRAHGICPSWYYHLIDVEPLVVGYLAGLRAAGAGDNGRDADLPSPPWRSDDLALAVGVETREEDRHPALGDARWVRDVYDAVMGGRPPVTHPLEDEPLHGLGDLARALGGDETSFTGQLLKLTAKADPDNRLRLYMAFPRIVRAWELWTTTRPTPTERQLVDALDTDERLDVDLTGLSEEQAYGLGLVQGLVCQMAQASGYRQAIADLRRPDDFMAWYRSRRKMSDRTYAEVAADCLETRQTEVAG